MWLTYALLAAILWGFNYSLSEKLLHHLAPATLLAIEMAFGSLFFGTLSYFTTAKRDFNALATDPHIFWLTMLEVIVILLANYFIVSSIFFKNATMAGIIELIYPLFTIFFSWFLFNTNHVNSNVIIGGFLIFIGVLVISRG
ncbi:MAG: DMT family transporter [Proteobacteria bacterium]|nr:DMT family transporter [Pseudomonadota bacterium]